MLLRFGIRGFRRWRKINHNRTRLLEVGKSSFNNVMDVFIFYNVYASRHDAVCIRNSFGLHHLVAVYFVGTKIRCSVCSSFVRFSFGCDSGQLDWCSGSKPLDKAYNKRNTCVMLRLTSSINLISSNQNNIYRQCLLGYL